MVGLLFSIGFLFLLERGPYRAVRFSRAYDFSTVYASARCWIKGENPYDSARMKSQLVAAGAPPRLVEQQDLNPAVYLISALPLMALLAWLPWEASNIVWCATSLGVFLTSLCLILKQTDLSSGNKWLFAGLCFLFCPTYVGLHTGNPSVLSIAFLSIALYYSVKEKPWISGALLGATLCLKPQIAVCGVLVLALWKRLNPLLLACGVLAMVVAVGLLRVPSAAEGWRWWQSERQNTVIQFAPGGPGNAMPSSTAAFQFLDGQPLLSYLVSDSLARTALIVLIAAALIVLYCYRRRQMAAVSPWRDIGFFSALTIFVSYHRYYDGQIFLLLIPFLVESWNTQNRKLALALGGALLVLATPDQSVFAKLLGPRAAEASLLQFVLLRHQPLAVLSIALILASSVSKHSTPELPGMKRGARRRLNRL